MDEIKVIREALEAAKFYIDRMDGVPATQSDINKALEVLARLEAREVKKTVPLAMLREIMDMAIREGGSMHRAYGIVVAHGYEVIE